MDTDQPVYVPERMNARVAAATPNGGFALEQPAVPNHPRNAPDRRLGAPGYFAGGVGVHAQAALRDCLGLPPVS